MAVQCNCTERKVTALAASTTGATGASAGVTWLASSITQPLVGGAVGGLSMLATMITVATLTAFKFDKETVGVAALITLVSAPVVFAMAATALGFPVSIPLSLLLAVVNCVLLNLLVDCF